MIQRRTLSNTSSRIRTPAKSYPIWLDKDEADNVRYSLKNSDKQKSPEWASAAIARLMRETDDELHSLLNGRKYNSKDGKEMVSIRVRQQTIDEATQLAEKHDASIQTVFSTAFAMHALAPDLTKVNEIEDEAEADQTDE